ncbi:hypothetical protein QMK19_28985 [Streptomyces sp. H10-C2]|uniref:hypothetical protein n=1 Tax=Streptomyces TaxID=1883 RepID=UPI0018DF75AB|nr:MULTISPECIES: hypothetical protein [Streptomyces]MDJ0344246.1 hypothetical protein [Streptomyces sp. PH10-H1]MDJ0373584.1 hypothetical protein [Streptomyces sp. H10-C2]
MEAILGVVGAYTELIAEEENRPETVRDEQKLTEYRRRRTASQREREALDPTDSKGIARVRAQYAEQLHILRRGGRV